MASLQFGDRLCKSYHEHPRTFVATVVFLALLCLRASVLVNPPHWDGIMGPYAEAVWLKNNGFDYWRLIHEEPRYPDGGAAVYMWSVIPGLYALLYTFFSPVTVFVILHLVNFMMAAIMAGVLYGILRERAGASDLVAAMAVGAMMVQPAFAGQVDDIKMEIPVAFCILLSADAMLRHRYWRACVWSFAALLVKDSGLIVCFGNAAFAALLILSRRAQRTRALIVACILPIVLRYAVSSYVFSVPGMGDARQPVGLLQVPKFLTTTLRCCIPDVVVMLLLIAALAVYLAVRMRLWNVPAERRTLAGVCANFLERFGEASVYGLILSAGFVCVFLLITGAQPRYVTWCLAFMMLALSTLLRHALHKEEHVAACLGVFLVFGALNSGGILYPSLPPEWGRSGELLERSREYIQDIRSNQRLAAFLQQHARGKAIVATCPMDRILTLPEMGYVDSPLEVYTVWTVPTHAPVKSCELLTVQDADRIVIVYKPTVFNDANPTSLAPRPEDEVLFADWVSGAPAIVYRLRGPSTLTPAAPPAPSPDSPLQPAPEFSR